MLNGKGWTPCTISGAVDEERGLGEGEVPCGAKKGKCPQCSLGTAPKQVGGRGEAFKGPTRQSWQELRLVPEEPSSASRAAPDPEGQAHRSGGLWTEGKTVR